MMASFISKASFDNKVAAQREKETVTQWPDINKETIYKITKIKPMVGRYGDCWLADALDKQENTIKFFAPSSMVKKIKKEKKEKQSVFFISLGQTFNKLDKTKRNRFDVIFEADPFAIEDIFIE